MTIFEFNYTLICLKRLRLSKILEILIHILTLTFILMIYIIFGIGFVIEFPFFPQGIEQFLKLIPISFPFQIAFI